MNAQEAKVLATKANSDLDSTDQDDWRIDRAFRSTMESIRMESAEGRTYMIGRIGYPYRIPRRVKSKVIDLIRAEGYSVRHRVTGGVRISWAG